MTNRDFLNAVISANISDEMTDFAKAEIAKLDARNDKRRNTLSKEQKANEGVKEQILAYLANAKNAVASEIAGALDLSTQKVSALCRQLVESGAVAVTDIKVKGKGAVKSYSVKE